MLQTRGEFVLILATLSIGAGLDERIVPFAGLYVLIMAVIAPVIAVYSERIGAAVFPRARSAARSPDRDRSAAESIALVEAATRGQLSAEEADAELEELPSSVHDDVLGDLDRVLAGSESTDELERHLDDVGVTTRGARERQADEQSDAVTPPARQRDPEY
jgi:CPA2 family monovalent cation:H+ antiporter-2